ncbi:SusC/RagA family TonB-linked outer membrane protein [Mucilaginibacter sp. UR6-1]|uniref:SusC/RagA family TonB-linked outer membrane protein n=1 Tax=Mucilaginibacter sp. UR6-1 TaxID=1435643 RepID=UPI001E4391AC|nr:SusC/RagA family TonB-linked outer membrane protein [Mucilaginibacter sp. UR6-1]MCC8409121.1 SusC/RagA family TonB-linked outer membrane protein [Mucilaginibacter sp. UR6-1]
MKRRSTLTLVFLALCCSLTFAQSRAIRGRVTDNTNQTLVGVSILIKGTSTGTVTDTAGRFRINASAGNILIVSYLGYVTKEVTVSDRDEYDVKLSSADNMLNETVVIGYQTISRRSVTTAVSSVGTKDIAPTTTSNVGEALQGKVPGLQVFQGGGNPGSQPKMLIRGFATITGSSDPLIVVDGVITSFGSLNDINPSDIDKVDVLKDAAATAIYGSRGGAGVLLVSTKRGKEKTQVNFNGTSGMSYWVNPKLAGTEEFVNHYSRIYADNNQTLPATAAVTGINTDWWKESTKNAYTHNYNVSASGSKNGLTFYGSAGYFDQSSNYQAQRNTADYRKITTRFNIDYEISKVFKIGVNLAPRMEDYGNGGGTGLFNIMSIAPNVAVTKSAEQTQTDVNTYAASNPSWNFTAYNPAYSQFTRSNFNNINNPVAAMARNFNNTKLFGTQGSTYIEIKPITGLTLRSSLAGFYNSQNTTSYAPKYFIDPQDRNDVSGVSQNTVTNYRWQIDNTINYIGSAGKHHYNILAGQSADNYTYNNSYVFRQNIPYDAEPYRYVGSGATIADASGTRQPGAGPFGKMTSYFGRVSYDFNNTYYIAASFRADGSSLLSPQNRWGYFPTVSGAYVITNEEFMKSIKWLSYLKLRGSYGRVGGNLPGAPGAYQSTLGLADYVSGDRSRIYGYVPSNVPDPNIKWETTQDVTIGLDADLFNNKLSVTADKYWRSPKDMLLFLPVQPSLGYPQGYIPTVYTNVGSIRTSGWEVGLNYKDKVGGVSFGVGLTLQRFLSKAVDLRGQVLYDEISNDVFQSTRRTKTEAGDILGGYYGYDVIGVFQTAQEVQDYRSGNGTVLQPNARPGDFKYANINGDNTIDLNDRKNIGNPYPKLSSGLTLQASYHGFDFRTEFYGSFGNKIADDYLVRMNPVYGYNFISGKQNQFWTGPGSTNSYPILSLSDPNGNFSKNSTFFIKDGTYVRNKLVQLGYTIPSSTFNGKANIRVYVSAQNLFTITGYDGLNPEVPFAGILRYGIDNGQNPIPKFFNIGFNANF